MDNKLCYNHFFTFHIAVQQVEEINKTKFLQSEREIIIIVKLTCVPTLVCRIW